MSPRPRPTGRGGRHGSVPPATRRGPFREPRYGGTRRGWPGWRPASDREQLALVEGHGDPRRGDAGVDERTTEQLRLRLDHRDGDAVAGADGLPDRRGHDGHLRRAGRIVIEERPDCQGAAARRLAIATRCQEHRGIDAIGERLFEELLLEARELQRLAVSCALRWAAVCLDEADRAAVPGADAPLFPRAGRGVGDALRRVATAVGWGHVTIRNHSGYT